MDEKEFEIRRITKALEEHGNYTPALDLLISTCAEVTVLKSKAFKFAKKKTPTVKEKTREGEVREKPHPAHVVFMDYVEAQRKELSELRLTAKTITSTTGDGYDDLEERVTEAGKDGE